MKNLISLLLIAFVIIIGCKSPKRLSYQQVNQSENLLDFTQLKTDTIFNSNQVISLLTINKNDLDNFSVKFKSNSLNLKTTSSIAKDNNAIAAVNGGFFNIDSGESLRYFEVDDIVINKTNNKSKQLNMTDTLMNGAIVIKKDSKIILEHAKSEQFYESSKEESSVLVSGPLLIIDSKILNLPNTNFVNNKHPRTCLCELKESILFITIDGRSINAEGMSLFEVQRFLMSLGCVNAINLDGGGSTTMWIKNKGVVNFPSDNNAERPVSNALLILNKIIIGD